jgi:hypothetical protein
MMAHDQGETMQGLGCGRGCAGAGPRYQWVQGVDGLGHTIGYWRPTQSLAPNAPYARNTAPFFGEIAEAADGQLYQWVQGVDGLGSPFGFWKRLKRLARRALPLAQRIAPFVPGGAAALTMATPFLKQAGIAGLGDIGALYAAPDGTLYQVQGIDADDRIDGAADDELNGISADELEGLADDEVNGLADDDELRGLADDELEGLAADDELSGFGEGNDLDGFAADDLDGFADDELHGVGDDEQMSGFVRDGINGIDGYRPDDPPRTPEFSPAPNAPMWAPLW